MSQLGPYVYVLNPKDRSVEKRYIKLGKQIDDVYVVVSEGLKEGELVVVQGLMRLKPDVKVDYKLIVNDSFSTDTEHASDSPKSNK